ncbi:MAG: transcription-repair coupling factor [Hahellaceae bacterium]|nr:transcription-repair coupling factor [Hahellaceae bacterium]
MLQALSALLPPLPKKAADHRQWGNVSEGLFPLLLAQAIKSHQGHLLLITQDSEEAQALEESIRFYLGQTHTEIESDTPVLILPDWETLPYDVFSPHEDITSQRLQALYQLPNLRKGILIAPVNTVLHKLAPPQFLQRSGLVIKTTQKLALGQYQQSLAAAGYRHVETVYNHGEFTARGSIVDIFPMGSDLPYRIELFDDDVESIRTFDPDTQRTIEKISEITLLPAYEFPWDKESRSAFRNRWGEHFPNVGKESPLYNDICSGLKSPGLEYYLPLFFDETASLFDYLPQNTLIFSSAKLEQASTQFWHEINDRFESLRHDRLRPILPPAELFIRTEQLFGYLKAFPRVSVIPGLLEPSDGKINLIDSRLPDISINHKLTDPLSRLKSLQSEHDAPMLVCAESIGRREALQDLFRANGLVVQTVTNWNEFISNPKPLNLTVASLKTGILAREHQLAIIAEADLYGQRVLQRRRRKKGQEVSTDAVFKDLTELQLGSPVVHMDHGVGRYQGLQTLEIDGQPCEFLTLEYADNAKLYVPVSSLHLISRYSGTEDSNAPLHRLGTDKWSTAKRKAIEKIRDTAAELLDIYARRQAKTGFAYEDPDTAYNAFSEGFPFEETPDQLTAIQAVIADMTSPRPMDRLVCGDVGFGKTEVAMRATFMATYSGKQVGVLVPTTLLAQQHYESFKDRFAETAVKVELLSRFRSAKEQAKAIEQIEAGTVDVVIGTHKLIQQNIKFKDLGLLIIDEEHRFGVQQKERLKSLRAEVDILTLTATPIPRTLNMALGGMRDLSVIATPPARRLSVKTFVRQRDNDLLKEAILREILRGGQVYYLFNEVKNIEKEAEALQMLVPEARVTIAHGQMRERELEQVMSDFYHKKFNVLVCTTIIETGIDIPSANTIIIDRADKFGLAQLHQLRGRVGRSHHQAYAYLMTPSDKEKKITPDAEKRLEAISASQDLGAGFMLATHDLEIRGAGELLGEEQSGQIESIGFSLYMELLEQAVTSLKKGEIPNLDKPLRHGLEINLRIPALIPEDYLPDVHTRLIMYKRISSVQDKPALDELQIELIDRFGLLPPPTKNLFRQTELKFTAEPLGIVKIDVGESSGRIEFSANTPIDPLKIIKLIQSAPALYKFDGADALKFALTKADSNDKIGAITRLLNQLKQPMN